MLSGMARSTSFGAVLCDVDGVVRQWDGSMNSVDTQFGLTPGTLASTAFRSDLLTPAITGTVSDEEWRAAVADELGRQIGSPAKARAAVATWSTHIGRVDQHVLALLTQVREETPVSLVSNATTRLNADLAALGVTPAVDAVLATCELGFAKPDARAYLAAAELVMAEPSRCLFIDDTTENVVAARDVGMTGVVYHDADQLRRVLHGKGLIKN